MQQTRRSTPKENESSCSVGACFSCLSPCSGRLAIGLRSALAYAPVPLSSGPASYGKMSACAEVTVGDLSCGLPRYPHCTVHGLPSVTNPPDTAPKSRIARQRTLLLVSERSQLPVIFRRH